jgi:hypothetical protein
MSTAIAELLLLAGRLVQAEGYGLTIPESFLLRADALIE